MKVGLVVGSISRTGGGVAESVRLQALSLTCEVEVFSFRDSHSAEDLPSWSDIPVRLFRGHGPRRYQISLGLLRSLLVSDCDIIHVHGLWHFQSLAVYIFSLWTGRPYVVTPHGMLEAWILRRSARLKKFISWLYQDRFLRRAVAFQVLTPKERLDVAPYVRNQVVVEIPNYVSEPGGVEGRPSWWSPQFEGKNLYLFLGRLHEKKGCIELLSAWDEICAADETFRRCSVLVFCGWIDGLMEFETAVARVASEYGNVIYAGPQYGSDKTLSFSNAGFFILPSKSEGLPMAVLEAWVARRPVIMTEECNLPVGWAEGAAIRTAPRVRDIADSLKQAHSLTEVERAEMGRNGYRIVERYYSKASVGEALRRLYDDCIQHEINR